MIVPGDQNEKWASNFVLDAESEEEGDVPARHSDAKVTIRERKEQVQSMFLGCLFDT